MKQLRPCLKNRSRRREEAHSGVILAENPPPHVGGYTSWVFFKHALSGLLILGIVFAAEVCLAGVESLRCEYLMNPSGIDATEPRLSWILTSSRRGEKQTAYQILVASSRDLLNKEQGDLWDSGKVVSDESSQISYAGRSLASRQSCFWKVRIWDGDGNCSRWSPIAQWQMGLLHREDWSAKWVTAQ